MPRPPRTWCRCRRKRAAAGGVNVCPSLICPAAIHLPFLLPSFFWICRRRIRARNKPVKYRNVYKPTTTWSLSVRLSSKSCGSVVLDMLKEDLWSARDLKRRRKTSDH